MSQLRYYINFYPKEVSLIPNLSDYVVGNALFYIPRFIIYLEKIFGFDFMYVTDHPQNFSVSRTTMTFAINAPGVLSSATDNEIFGTAIPIL